MSAPVPYSVERAILRHTVTPADVLARLTTRFREDAISEAEEEFETAAPIDYDFYANPDESSDEELRELTAEVLAEDARLRRAS